MAGIASAATAVVIGYVAGGTRTIRVGAGGIMLPNHAPLVVAEQFGTLESLYPGRIDLGLGRAPGTDQRTMRALRRDPASADTLSAGRAGAAGVPVARAAGPGVQAVPGAGLERAAVDPGLESVRRAARRGARSAVRVRVALHAGRADARRSTSIAPHSSHRRSSTGRTRWRASMSSPRIRMPKRAGSSRRRSSSSPTWCVARPAGCRLRSTTSRATGIRSRKRRHRRDSRCRLWARARLFARGLAEFIEQTAVDEIIVASMIYDHAARVRSYEILADVIARELH